VTNNPELRPVCPDLNSWSINGVNQLNSEWYYFMSGNSSGRQASIRLNTGTTRLP